jgi:hypothetical protein
VEGTGAQLYTFNSLHRVSARDSMDTTSWQGSQAPLTAATLWSQCLWVSAGLTFNSGSG